MAVLNPRHVKTKTESHYAHEIQAIFYHAGCPVCVVAEQSIAVALDRNRYDVEVVHLGSEKERVGKAESAG